MKKSITTTLTREGALAEAQKNSELELARIDHDVQAHIATELTRPCKGKSVQARLFAVLSDNEHMVNRIVDGKLVACQWSDLSANEQREAYNVMFNS